MLNSTKKENKFVNFNSSELKIFEMLKKNDSIKRKNVELKLNISQPMAIKLLKGLLNKKAINKIGAAKNTRYLCNTAVNNKSIQGLSVLNTK